MDKKMVQSAVSEVAAKLSLNEAEREQVAESFDEIVAYLAQVADVPVTEATVNTNEEKLTDGGTKGAAVWHNYFREDEVEPSYDRTDILKNASDKTEEMIRVPRTIG